MERIVMTWGFIPEENVSETIYCGDGETSGTIELNFEIIGDTCRVLTMILMSNLIIANCGIPTPSSIIQCRYISLQPLIIM